MAEGLNRVMLIGNLGADPELRMGQESAVLKLRLATTESFVARSGERQERTDWHNVTIFGKRGEALSKILAKGSSLYIEGRLQTSSYEKDGQKVYRTEVVATNVLLLGGRGAGGEARPSAPRSQPGFMKGGRDADAPPARSAPVSQDAGDDYGAADPGEDDIPF